MWWTGHKWDHAGDVAVASMGYLYGGRDGGRKKSCTGISRFARVPHIVIQPLPPHTLILVACQCVGPWCRISVSHTPDTFGRDQQSNIKCWGCGGYGFHATSLVQASFRQPYAHPRANSHARCPATLQAAVMGVVVVVVVAVVAATTVVRATTGGRPG